MEAGVTSIKKQMQSIVWLNHYYHHQQRPFSGFFSQQSHLRVPYGSSGPGQMDVRPVPPTLTFLSLPMKPFRCTCARQWPNL